MQKVIDFLKLNSHMVLATCSNNKPRATVMEYTFVGENILFSTMKNSIKAENLRQNNQISFFVESMPFFVTVDGIYETPSENEIKEYKRILLENHPEFEEMAKSGMMEGFVYFKIIPKTAYFNDYSQGMKPTEIIEFN